jgi:transposase
METEERGNLAEVAREAKVSQNTIRRGMRELEAGDLYKEGERVRGVGGGRKPLVESDETLVADLEGLLQPKGDPMREVQWTSKSLSHLVKALEARGQSIKKSALADLLHKHHFSLKANKRTIEGKPHPDRNAQFEHIHEKCGEFENKGNPAISVDCKKRELLGNFKNNGREWQAKGEDTCVNVYDFASLADGKAVPYGIYDLVQKTGFVNVGVDHETAEFAVESIRRWWQQEGRRLYPEKKELLITCDGGSANGSRNNLWKKKLQELANEEQLTITVAHYPPGTSKWNKIEHQLFSFISINWRAIPLTSLEVVIHLISGTTNDKGLTVIAVKDSNLYPTGIKVTEKEMKNISIIRDAFHGDWN